MGEDRAPTGIRVVSYCEEMDRSGEGLWGMRGKCIFMPSKLEEKSGAMGMDIASCWCCTCCDWCCTCC